MSGIAGIVRFDGAPVESGLIERMTSAMAHRGPDGIRHWTRGSVALGQCMLCTTPESLDERQPLANEDGGLVLVMDGRVDNGEELRRELLGRGAVLRDRTDAELVLRAYEAWGDDCPDRIVGEFVFVVWDARRRRLFGARDAAGTRHFTFHSGNGWFGFASEIKSLLATGLVEPRLNESRVLDYLVVDFDRDDEVGTFYEGIFRLPAGHAMEVAAGRARTWRYWNPAELPDLAARSLDEWTEAFLDQLRVAVKCRLRSIGTVGAMLSGGLDSSSIVALIRKEFRSELQEPLRTYSLIRHDRENCSDWQAIREMLTEGWIEPTIIASDDARAAFRDVFDGIGAHDEPFAPSQAFMHAMLFQRASRDGCTILLDGVAGDLHFYSPARSLSYVVDHWKIARLPAMVAALRHHRLDVGYRRLAWMALRASTPPPLRAAYRRLQPMAGTAGALRTSDPGDLRALLHPKVVVPYLEARIARRRDAGARAARSERHAHARRFTSGLLSFAHEGNELLAQARGIEMRSPFSDRRLIELSVRAPVEWKLSAPWYKHRLREAMAGILPETVRWRRTVGEHPGWTFREQLVMHGVTERPEVWQSAGLGDRLSPWVDRERLAALCDRFERTPDARTRHDVFSLAVLANWLTRRFPRSEPDRSPLPDSPTPSPIRSPR